MRPDVCVVICAHDPRPDHLERVLDALRLQSLPPGRWELLLVDNASASPLAERHDLAWQPAGRHLREERLGVVHARLLGIAQARADLLVFVDDDNLLAADYLVRALEIADRYLMLGAWSGDVSPGFQEPPQAWTRPHWPKLTIRPVPTALWSNDLEDDRVYPYGAGLCVRAAVAQAYAQGLAADPLRRRLDRRGASLASAGDVDLGLCGRELGLGWGLFPELKLVHLIAPARLEEAYLLRLQREMTASNVALRLLLGLETACVPLWKVLARCALQAVRHGRRAALFAWAAHAGARQGVRQYRDARAAG